VDLFVSNFTQGMLGGVGSHCELGGGEGAWVVRWNGVGGHRELGGGEGAWVVRWNGVGGHRELVGREGAWVVRWKVLAVIVSWEGERGLGWTCSGPYFTTVHTRRGWR
jgi:hypothetical protein